MTRESRRANYLDQNSRIVKLPGSGTRHRLAGMGARAETGSDSAVQAPRRRCGWRKNRGKAGRSPVQEQTKGKVITMQAKVEGRVMV